MCAASGSGWGIRRNESCPSAAGLLLVPCTSLAFLIASVRVDLRPIAECPLTRRCEEEVRTLATATGSLSAADATSTGRRTWFVGPRTDIGLVFGAGSLLSIALFVASSHKTWFLVAAVLFAMLSDYPHVLATSARVWLDPRERDRYGRRYLVSLAIIGAAVTGLMLGHLVVVVVTVWAYWQVLHVLKQHYGILNIYAAKNGYRSSRRLARWVLFTGCLAPFLFRASHGLRFSEYVIFGYRLPFSDLVVPTPPIPEIVIVAGYGAFLVLLVLFTSEQLSLARAGAQRLPGAAIATMASAIVSYNVAYLLVSDLFALILIATTTHSLQYHLINWTRNSTRFERSGDPAERGLLLARLSHPRAVPAYAGLFAVLGVLTGQIDTVLLGIIPLTLVFHHFYLDGVIWKGKGNPELAYELGIRVSRSGPATDGQA